MSPSITVDEVGFQSEGYRLRGRVYRPTEEGKYPAVVICHGFPGNTKNMDLAESLAFNGIVTLVFFYRGAWGSEGDYSIAATVPSTRDAVAYLKILPYVDAKRVGLVSHSMGTIPNVATLSRDKSLKTGVLLGPVNDESPWAKEPLLGNVAAGLSHGAEGRLTGYTSDKIKEDLRYVAKHLNPSDNISNVRIPLLVVVGSADTVTVPEECKKLFDKANEPKKWVVIDGSDHDFSEHRIPLTAEVLGWLKAHL